jgi:Ca2+-binding EF-hand superfamily protein
MYVKILQNKDAMMKQATRLFDQYDKDGNGTLDKKELKSYFMEFLKGFGNIAFK